MTEFPSVSPSLAEADRDSALRPSFAWSASRDLRDGDAGIEQTIALVRKVVWQSLSDPWTRMQAATLLRSEPAVEPYNDAAKAYRFWRKVYENISFVDHPIAHQLVQSPQFTVSSRIGNCTDINAVLLSSLLMNVGIPAHLVTVANNPNHPDEFNHVYVEAQIDGEWIPVDAARPGASFGTTVPNIYRSRAWDLLSRDYADRRGLNGSYMGQDTPYDSTIPYGPPIPADSPAFYDVGPYAPPYVRPGGYNVNEGTGAVTSPGGSWLGNLSNPAWLNSILAPIASIFRPSSASPYGTAPASAPSFASSLGGSSNILLIGALSLGAVLLIGKKK